MAREPSWTTANEIAFLDGIEYWTEHGVHQVHHMSLSRRKLLINYQNSIPHRKNWGDIDKFQIMKYLEKELDYGY